jgi:hypothetical protein
MPKIKLECHGCGKEIFRYPSAISRRNGYNYCSLKCRDKIRRQLPDKHCEVCGVLFRPKGRRDAHRFCSRACNLIWRVSQVVYVKMKCEFCGRVFLPKQNRPYSRWVDGKPIRKKYCSKECVDNARVGRWVKDKCPAWKGGTTSLQDTIRKSPAWMDCRTAVFERDGYKSVISNENGPLAHHHLTAIAILLNKHGVTKENWRDKADVLFDLSNAVTLMAEEHKDFHSQYGKVTTPDQFHEYLAARQLRPVEQ